MIIFAATGGLPDATTTAAAATAHINLVEDILRPPIECMPQRQGTNPDATMEKDLEFGIAVVFTKISDFHVPVKSFFQAISGIAWLRDQAIGPSAHLFRTFSA